jgi:chromosome partitioning protein
MALPRIIAIASQKGGVAKTTTCVSLGASLAEQDKRVLLIDLDPQAHLTLSLGLEPEGLGDTVADAVMGNASLASISRETDVPFLHLAPASEKLSVVDKWLYGRANYEHLVKNRLDALPSERYDVILMDSPPSFGTLMLNALTAAELLVIPTPCEYYASRSLRRLLQLVRLVREKTNPMLAYRVLITMFDPSDQTAHMIREQMERAFAGGLLDTVIEVDAKLRESAVASLPITLYAPLARGAAQYRALAQELMNYERRRT